MTIVYYAGGDQPPDRLPAWPATISTNGVLPDLSDGWSFTVLMSRPGEETVTKTSGITGAPGGLVTVQWADDELELAPGTWRLALIATRIEDGAPFTVRERLYIRERAA